MAPVRTLVADPPWPFKDRLPGGGRGAAKHYALLDVDAIARFPLPPLAPDAWLFLWRVASMQRAALHVAEAWGFRSVAEIVWIKADVATLPKVRIGMGRYVRNAHESCLVAVRPGALRSRLSASVPSVFFAPRSAHSAKPDEFFDLVERLAPGPRAELFARRRRAGWLCFGDELGEDPNDGHACPAE